MKKNKLIEKIKNLFDRITKWLDKIIIYKLFRETFHDFGEHKVVKMSAALSYYTTFALPALLAIIIGLTSLIFGQEIVEGKVFKILNDYIGDKLASQLQAMLRQSAFKNTSIWATIIGGVTLLLSASGVFGEIQDSLNTMWALKAKPKKGWLKLLMNRLMSFSMLLVLAFILLVSLALTTAIDVFVNFLTQRFSNLWVKVFNYINYVVILAAVTTLFTFIFKFLPDGKVKWKDAFVGALLTGVFFVIGKFLISFYISKTNLTAFGGATSLAVLLIWVYYSSIIMYFGAEFTQVFAAYKGRKIEPKQFAVRVITEEHERSSAGKKQETEFK